MYQKWYLFEIQITEYQSYYCNLDTDMANSSKYVRYDEVINEPGNLISYSKKLNISLGLPFTEGK